MTGCKTQRDTLVMPLLILVAGIVLSLFSERIFVGSGLGFDGCSYGAIITRYEDVRSGALPISSDLYFRIVPALGIRGVMQALSIPLTVPNVIIAFKALNVILLTIASWLWGRCADQAGLGRRGKWLGFIGIFCNYAVLKYNFYYPVLFDTASLACSLVLAWLYQAHRTRWLPIAGLAAFFIAPNVGLEAFLLFLLPSPTTVETPPPLAQPAAVAAAALAVAAAWSVLTLSSSPSSLAMALSLIAIGGGAYCLARAAGFTRAALANPAVLARLGIVAGLVIVLTVLPRLLPRLPSFEWFTLFFRYVQIVLLNSTQRPGEFVVAHTLYFGPIFLISICLFAPVCRAARRLGGGWLLVLAFGLIQGLNPLSRQMIGILPFLVLPTCLAIGDRALSRPFLWILAAASLAVSKVWQRINAGADFSASMDSQPQVWSRYLESTGYWMLEADYHRQGLVVAGGVFVLAGVLYWLRRPGQTAVRQ